MNVWARSAEAAIACQHTNTHTYMHTYIYEFVSTQQSAANYLNFTIITDYRVTFEN
jgi:hypothetical protein